MRRRATAPKRAPKRAEHDHCEWLNDRHVGYCREPGKHVFRHPRGDMGVLFVCAGHALDALDAGKPLPISSGPVERR